jgi:hypothetical protein
MPVRRAADALFLLGLAARDPLQRAVYTFFLDRDGIGGVITEVTGCDDPDAVLDVVEVMATAAQGVERALSLVVATVRPDAGVLPGDIDRWLEASAICEQFGVELVEWFVISPHGVECPRDLLGEPERWSFNPRRDVAPG